MHQNEIHLMNLVADIDLHILASDTTALNLETHTQFSKLTKKKPTYVLVGMVNSNLFIY